MNQNEEPKCYLFHAQGMAFYGCAIFMMTHYKSEVIDACKAVGAVEVDTDTEHEIHAIFPPPEGQETSNDTVIIVSEWSHDKGMIPSPQLINDSGRGEEDLRILTLLYNELITRL